MGKTWEVYQSSKLMPRTQKHVKSVELGLYRLQTGEINQLTQLFIV